MTRSVALLAAAAASLVACGGSGTPACQNSCADAGATQCSGAQVQTCTADSKGCLSLSSAVPCPTGQSCSASTNGCLTPSDPCHGVPTNGHCLDSQTVELCASATGQGSPSVYSHTCPSGESCSTSSGTATCVATGSCTPGATSCLDSTHLETCTDGNQTTTTCPNSCLNSALGSICTSALATTSLSFTVKYTARGPNADYTDWSTDSQDVTVSNLLVLSFSGSDAIDAQTTDANGNVTVLVPSSPQSADQIVLVAAASDGTGGLAFIVADPGFSTSGTQDVDSVGTPKIWTWAAATTSVSSGGTLTVTEDSGSGALRVFDYLRYVYYHSVNLEGHLGLSLVVWVGYGTSWSCGSCFSAIPAAVSSLQFNSQIWLDANTTDQRWWSDAVTAHELGHWVMKSYGTSPGEGGTHIVGVPSEPGLDWSEGWATWHSAFTRGSSIYYDKQQGSMFYFDIATDHYSDRSWQLPTPSGGLLQLMDENEVSSMLWSIGNDPSVGGSVLFNTLSGSHMNTSPWARGYSRRTWTLDDNGVPTNVMDTGEPAPCIADFLDALDCGGVSPAVIDAATVPATQYPYPSASPICH